ncbi:hypothetical protein EDD15DRAFT_1714824 [Pisolithus albus]|nr:hypothetical protein EDD15DRAFT_1714824 [Pisolithus albus]
MIIPSRTFVPSDKNPLADVLLARTVTGESPSKAKSLHSSKTERLLPATSPVRRTAVLSPRDPSNVAKVLAVYPRRPSKRTVLFPVRCLALSGFSMNFLTLCRGVDGWKERCKQCTQKGLTQDHTCGRCVLLKLFKFYFDVTHTQTLMKTMSLNCHEAPNIVVPRSLRETMLRLRSANLVLLQFPRQRPDVSLTETFYHQRPDKKTLWTLVQTKPFLRGYSTPDFLL